MTRDTLFSQASDPMQIINEVKGVLAAVSPHFLAEDEKFKNAARNLIKSTSIIQPSAGEYLCALEELHGYQMLYIGWQGFQYNLDCFNSPVNALLLQGDFETLHRERRLHTLTSTHRANLTISSFHTGLKEHGLLDLTDDVNSYYATIETEGYKIAHYLGFLFADHFLPLVVPGYTSDSVLTNTYTMLLSRSMGFSLFALEREINRLFSRRINDEKQY